MKKLIFLSLVMFFSLSTWTWAASPLPIEDGEWEFTVESEVSGMPMKMPPRIYKQCLKKDNPVPQNNQPGQECTSKDVKISGNKVTWKLQCKSQQGEMTGEGKATYQKESMQGTMTMHVQGMVMVTTYKGHRIGPCK
jgi:hypothetical protein